MREATTLDPVTKRRKRPPQSKPEPKPQRPEDRTAQEKLKLVLEASALSDVDLGEFLRRHGIHEGDLEAWREAALGALNGPASSSARSGDARRVRELEKEGASQGQGARGDCCPARAPKKKVRAIWGDAHDDTKPGSDD